MTRKMKGDTRPWEATLAKFSPETRRAIQKEVQRELEAMAEKGLSLSELRKRLGRTQVDVAAALGVTQGSLSQLENQLDLKLSTLRAYIEGLGGQLNVIAHFGDELLLLQVPGLPSSPYGTNSPVPLPAAAEPPAGFPDRRPRRPRRP